MSEHQKEVIVIGGGISGLTAAWHLDKAGVDVVLMEAESSAGGCTRTERRDGFLLEKGPFNIIVRDPTFEALLDDVADDINVVTASREARIRYIYRHGRLHAVPTNPIALATTGLLPVGSRFRLLRGLLTSPRATSEEETIEQVAARRFGQQTADTIVSAVISGIFAGDITKLSLKACFPGVARVDAEARSLIGYGIKSAFRARKKKASAHKRRWRGLVSIDGGLGALTETLGRRLGAALHSRCRANAIRATADGYAVDCTDADDQSHTLQCRHLVIASSAAEAGRLLEPKLPETAATLRSIESASLVVLSLGYRAKDIGHPLKGFGFLVPHNEPDFPLMGVLFADSIFPHHAPPDHRLIRVFIGGARNPEAVERTDDELVTTAAGAIRDLLQVTGDPVLIDICRYRSAIPQYHRGHTEKIIRVRNAIAQCHDLTLIGNYLEGVSLNDCIRLATTTARDIAQSIRGNRPERSSESPRAYTSQPGPRAEPVRRAEVRT